MLLIESWAARVGVAVLAAAAVLLGGASCSASAPPDDEIVVLSGRDDSAGKQRASLVQDWDRRHPEVRVRIVELSGSTDQQHDEMLKAAQAPDADVDVFNLDVTWTAEFADAGYVRRLDDPPDVADFLPGPLTTARYRGGLYALPFNTDAGLLFYDPDLVGCPADWDAIRDDAARLRARPQPRPAAVWAGQLGRYDGLVVNVLETLHALHPDQPDLFAAGQPALQQAVDTLRPSVDPGRVLPAALDFDEEASYQALLRGEVAMLRGWPVARGPLSASNADDPTARSRIAFCQLPRRSAVLGGQNLAVSSGSAHAALAEDLVRDLTSCAAGRTLFDRGGLAPTRRCAYDTSERSGDAFTAAVLEAVRFATPRPQGPCYGRFSALFSKEVHASLVGGVNVDLPPGFLESLRRALDCKPLR